MREAMVLTADASKEDAPPVFRRYPSSALELSGGPVAAGVV